MANIKIAELQSVNQNQIEELTNEDLMTVVGGLNVPGVGGLDVPGVGTVTGAVTGALPGLGTVTGAVPGLGSVGSLL